MGIELHTRVLKPNKISVSSAQFTGKFRKYNANFQLFTIRCSEALGRSTLGHGEYARRTLGQPGVRKYAVAHLRIHLDEARDLGLACE